jgi:hypothetical protein
VSTELTYGMTGRGTPIPCRTLSSSWRSGEHLSRVSAVPADVRGWVCSLSKTSARSVGADGSTPKSQTDRVRPGPGPTTPRFTAMSVNCRPTPTGSTNPPRPSAHLSGAVMPGIAAPSIVGLPTKTETRKLGRAVGVEKVPDPSGTSDECFAYRSRVVGQGERRDPSLDRRQRRGPPCLNDGRPWSPPSTRTRPGDGLVARPRPGTGRSRRRFAPLLSSPIQPAQPRSGVTVVLDSRWRLLLPYGIRVHSGLEFGIRLIVLAAPIEGLAAALPVSRVVSAFLGRS